MASRRDIARGTTAGERRAILAALAGSGLSIREFARRERIAAGTLSYWRHAEGQRSGRRRRVAARAQPHTMRFVELPSVGDTSGTRQAVAEGFELLLGDGRVVRIPPHFDAEALGRLLQVLTAPC